MMDSPPQLSPPPELKSSLDQSELVIHELVVEHPVLITLQKMTPVDLGPGSRATARTEDTRFQQNIAVLSMLAWLAELAESQPQVLKWAPVCSESGVV